jgi:two-component system sensor histidine kinase SenX3
LRTRRARGQSHVPDGGMQVREADKVLAEAHLLRHALDALPQAVVVHDQNGAVVFRNRHADNLVSPRHADALAARAVDDVLAAAVETGAASRTLELYGPPRRTLDLTGEAIRNATGEVVGAMAVIDDVSERRRLEDVRRDFVANVSHELRTPVGALALLAEALRDEHDETVVDRLAGRISDEAVRVGRIIEDLLDLSRMEADSSLPRDIVSLPTAVGHAIERVQQAAAQRDVSMKTVSVEDVPDVRGDERQLVSAVANLLDNAVKYSDAGAEVSVGIAHAGPWVEVAVHDHGVGIPSSDLERVFERFYRVDRARSRQTGGTGLGLAIVRHIANNHGGEVTVESREGEGSTFRLRLPALP